MMLQWMIVLAVVCAEPTLSGPVSQEFQADGESSDPGAVPGVDATSLPADVAGEQVAGAADCLAFADHLFGDGDYYRAITEYRRHLFLVRGRGASAGRAALAIGEAYLRARQYEAAAGQFESIARSVSPGATRAVALLNAGRAHLLGERPLLAAARLADARQMARGYKAIEQEATLLLGWSRLLQRDWEGGRQMLAEVADGPDAEIAKHVLVALEQRTALPEKNALLAGSLSLLPGLGHIYLGQWQVGLAAFFWNALFIAATGYSLWTQDWGVAAVLGVFELSWYAGTLFGALNGAFRYNQDIQENWLDDLRALVSPALELTPVTVTGGDPGSLGRLAPTFLE